MSSKHDLSIYLEPTYFIDSKPHQGYEQRGLARNHQKSILPVTVGQMRSS
jgi:hypothetical protein